MENQSVTMDEDEGDGAVLGAGADIRALRKSRSMSLSTLAGEIGRSIGWLSQVERGQTEPSITDLRAIAKLFAIPLSLFFRNEAAPGNERGRIVRKAQRVTLGSNEDGLREELLSPDLSGDFEMIRSVFLPGYERNEWSQRAAQDAGYLVSGTLDLWIGDHHYRLEAGDSFQFQNQPYRWRNSGTEPAVVIWVISPPVY
ncbi:MAG: XRE family transcriptional regulator [Rhizobiaceae bacterium]